MATVTVGPGGELTLPPDVVLRKGFKPDRAVRVVETRSGVLSRPLRRIREISEEFARELDAWQDLATDSWASFPYRGNRGMRVGEVFWVDLPARGGHAQMGRRPAIVLQTSEASSVLPTVLLIPMTTQLDATSFSRNAARRARPRERAEALFGRARVPACRNRPTIHGFTSRASFR